MCAIGRCIESRVQRRRGPRQEHALASSRTDRRCAGQLIVVWSEHCGAAQPCCECRACIKSLAQRVWDESLRRRGVDAPKLRTRSCRCWHRRELVCCRRQRRRCWRRKGKRHLECTTAGLRARADRSRRIFLLRASRRARRAWRCRPDLVDLWDTRTPHCEPAFVPRGYNVYRNREWGAGRGDKD